LFVEEEVLEVLAFLEDDWSARWWEWVGGWERSALSEGRGKGGTRRSATTRREREERKDPIMERKEKLTRSSTHGTIEVRSNLIEDSSVSIPHKKKQGRKGELFRKGRATERTETKGKLTDRCRCAEGVVVDGSDVDAAAADADEPITTIEISRIRSNKTKTKRRRLTGPPPPFA